MCGEDKRSDWMYLILLVSCISFAPPFPARVARQLRGATS